MLALAIGLLVIASARAAAAQDDGHPTLAVYHLTAGWATFGLVLPEGEALDAVKVGNLDTQTDVKSRWEDGSIKSAVVSANVPSARHYAITSADPSPGSPFAGTSVPTTLVELTILDGPAPGRYVAHLPGGGSDLWLSGPLVREARVIAQPTLESTQTVSPSLRVIFDVRSYLGGGHRIDVTVENALDVAIADAARYDVKIFVNGAIKFAKENVLHRYLARWRQVVTTTGVVESQVTPDFAPFVRALALPNYLPTVDNVARAITAADPEIPNVLLPEFDILQVGFLARPMEAHSGRPELAPYPDWAAQAIVHRQRNQLDFVLKNGELAGSWGVHIKKADGINLISIDERPGFWLDQRADVGKGPQNGLRGRATNAVDSDPTSGTAGDIAHQPSLAYLPYLITGDRYFLDEVAYWANYTLLATFQDAAQNLRGGGYVFPNGVMTPRFPGSHGLIFFNETRGIGWGLRNIADAAFILPDEHPLKDYFTEKVKNNLVWLDDYAATFNTGLLGSMFPYRRPEDGAGYSPYAWISMWEQSYVGWAVDRARRILEMPEGLGFLTRLAAFDLKLFTSAEFPREWAGIYLLAVGEHSTTPVDFNTDVIAYFGTMKEIFDVSSTAKFDADGEGGVAPPPGGVGDFYRQFEGFYGPEHRLLVMIARGLGMAGAPEAYDYLMAHVDDTRPDGAGTPGNISMLRDLNQRSGWAIGLGGVTPLLTDVAPDRPTLLINAAPITSPLQ